MGVFWEILLCAARLQTLRSGASSSHATFAPIHGPPRTHQSSNGACPSLDATLCIGTNYLADHYIHIGSGYSPDMARHLGAKAQCENCTGPFPFATGSIQGLSAALATAVANSPLARAHVKHVITSLGHSSRKTPAFEDVWLGYALVALLQRERGRRITIVTIDPKFIHDDLRCAHANMELLHICCTITCCAPLPSASAAPHVSVTSSLLLCRSCPACASYRSRHAQLDRASALEGREAAAKCLSGTHAGSPRLPRLCLMHSAPGAACVGCNDGL